MLRSLDPSVRLVVGSPFPLVQTAPTSDQRPDDLKDLAFRNGMVLNHLDWEAKSAAQKTTAASKEP